MKWTGTSTLKLWSFHPRLELTAVAVFAWCFNKGPPQTLIQFPLRRSLPSPTQGSPGVQPACLRLPSPPVALSSHQLRRERWERGAPRKLTGQPSNENPNSVTQWGYQTRKQLTDLLSVFPIYLFHLSPVSPPYPLVSFTHSHFHSHTLLGLFRYTPPPILGFAAVHLLPLMLCVWSALLRSDPPAFRVPAELTAGAADFNNDNKNGKALQNGPMALNGTTDHGPGSESDLKVELRATPTLAQLAHIGPHVNGDTAPAWDDDNAPALPPYNSACSGQVDGAYDHSTPTQQANGNKPVCLPVSLIYYLYYSIISRRNSIFS